MKDVLRVWITNGQVVWEIPPGRVSRFYLHRVYLTQDNWQLGSCGEMRKGNHERLP